MGSSKVKVFAQQQQPSSAWEELPKQQQASWIAIGAGVVVGGSTLMAQKKGSKAPGQAAAVDPAQVQLESIQGNARNSPEIEALLRRANTFTQGQNLSLLDQAIPGYSQIAQNLSNQAMQASADPYALPKEFSDNLARQAAERGINTGVRGQAGDFSLLRDFGINSLQFGQQQLASSQNILQTLAGLAKVNPLSPLSMYIQPGQALQGAYQQQSADQAALNAQQAAANRQAAAPWNALAAGVGTFAGMYGGGAAGGTTTVWPGNVGPSGTATPASSPYGYGSGGGGVGMYA